MFTLFDDRLSTCLVSACWLADALRGLDLLKEFDPKATQMLATCPKWQRLRDVDLPGLLWQAEFVKCLLRQSVTKRVVRLAELRLAAGDTDWFPPDGEPTQEYREAVKRLARLMYGVRCGNLQPTQVLLAVERCKSVILGGQ